MKLRQNELPVREYDLANFCYIRPVTNQGTGGLVAEASDLNGLSLQQLWNDSADAGIGIRSHRTGLVERFHLVCDEHRAGELVAWHLEPIDPNCPVKNVTIFND